MNITMLVLNNFTHDARVEKEARTLASAGHKVKVVALWKDDLPESEAKDGYQISRIKLRTRGWRNTLFTPMLKYLEYAAKVWQISRKEPIANVVHAHDGNTLLAASLAAKRIGAKLVYDAHELETGRNTANLKLASLYKHIWAWPERLFIKKASAVITVSNGIADELVQIYGISKPTVILNVPNSFACLSSQKLRQALSIPKNKKIILYQGGVRQGRGIEQFIEAVHQLPNVFGVILGDGPMLDEYQSKVKSGDWSQVYFPGRVNLAMLLSYTTSADIGVVLTQNTCRNHYFSLPNKLFEYIHAGIPVVGSDLPEIAKVIREYQIGEITDPEDPQAIAAAIKRLLDDPAWYQRAKTNTKQAAAVFNWEQEGKKLLSLYSEIENSECPT